jgi:hypothetical protein
MWKLSIKEQGMGIEEDVLAAACEIIEMQQKDIGMCVPCLPISPKPLQAGNITAIYYNM